MKRLAWIALLSVALLGGPIAPPSHAQSCTADVQCQRGGPSSQATCNGDTLIVRRSICVGGTCQTLEERRETCRSGSASRCVASGVERTESRCDGLLGRCVSRTDRTPCFPSCSCRGNTLTISSGQCLSTLGCDRSVLQCANGCTCTPSPQCL